MKPIKKIQIGEILLNQGMLTQQQLDLAIKKQILTGARLGQVLVDLGYVNKIDLLNLLAEQLKIPFIDIKNYTLDPSDVSLLSEINARRYRAIVLQNTNKNILIAMADPQDLVAFDELTKILKKNLQIALVSEDDLLSCIDANYRRTSQISVLAEELSAELIKNDYDVKKLAEGFSEIDAPVLKLLQSIFEDAVQAGASDVHIEPDEYSVRIRQRIDGVLHEQIINEKQISHALALRLKLMAGLNITEKRMPQDGRFSIRVHNKNYDIRLSTLPTQYGESVVMRLLNQSAELITLQQMGASAAMDARLKKILTLPNGLLLITGPTGSGKTTTLYSLLNSVNTAERKIITVEDPVEYRMHRINQVQVLPKINLTFAAALRSILRQDPDIIMIGELRDHETASIALRAAMTGHLVLATLHTNDAASSVVRLLDMGVEGYIVASVLRVAVAQRLVRRVCKNCIVDYELSVAEKVWVSAVVPYLANKKINYKIGRGCSYCHNTGFKGQTGVYEMLEINEKMADALRLNNSVEFARLVRTNKSFIPLVQSSFDLIQSGITSLSEIIRIIGESLVEDVPLENSIVTE